MRLAVVFALGLSLVVGTSVVACSDSGTGGGGGSGGSGGSGGTGGTGGTGGAGPTISITGLTFSPANLDVKPGDTVTVENPEAVEHSVTSEAAAGDFTPGTVSGIDAFDTGIFMAGTKTFTIPATAPAGTVVHYYCKAHLGAMTPSDPTITVVAP